jgi:leucyl aminopeptidase (aminopeptidase T)
MRIKNLSFYTDKGTDFRIGLSDHSRWISDPLLKNPNQLASTLYYNNFPSFEIFTTPDAFTASGKVVLTKPNNDADIRKATYEFEKGKVVNLKCDNDVWTRKVLESNEGVGLCRIGEIALVPNNTPISYVDVAKYNESDHKIVLSQTE